MACGRRPCATATAAGNCSSTSIARWPGRVARESRLLLPFPLNCPPESLILDIDWAGLDPELINCPTESLILDVERTGLAPELIRAERSSSFDPNRTP